MIVKAIIQARMSSTRLRGKTLMPLAGKTLLRRVIETSRELPFIDGVAVATSNGQEDDPIAAYCAYLGVDCVRGDRTDVAQRYFLAASELSSQDQIVRITADNPFCRFEACSTLFEKHIAENLDYSCVEGLSHVVYEFIKVEAFERILNNSIVLNDYDKEHVTPIFRKEGMGFRIQMVRPEQLGLKPTLEKLLTVDTESDLLRVEEMIKALSIDKRGVCFEDVYNWLVDNQPDSSLV